MDSASTDQTLAIAGSYADKDERLRIFSEPDKGIYDAMNKGIRVARGEWVYFLGSDDRLRDSTVLDEIFFVQDPEAPDLVYGDVYSPSYKGRYDGPFDFRKLLLRNISHQAIFYKKTLFDRLGYYDLRYKMHADWDFNLRCFGDPDVRTSYTGVLVATFGAGGVSAGHDLPFLRERLIPVKLRQLNTDGPSALRSIAAYDEWWRCLRNAGIRSAKELEQYTGDEPLLPVIRRMIRHQQQIPQSVLRKGPISKVLMLFSYLLNIRGL